MILGDVEETITTVDIDDETYEEIIKVRRWGRRARLRHREGAVLRAPRPSPAAARGALRF